MTVNRIITAKDYCKRDRVKNVRDRIAKLRRDMMKKKGIEIFVQFDKVANRPVYARIELGQWCASCECGGVEFVDPDEPIFFCFSCGNNTDSGMLRTVIFPSVEERVEIERLVLERPVEERRGLDDLELAHMSRPIIFIDSEGGTALPLTRTWNHGEPIENLVKENEAVDKWRDAINQIEQPIELPVEQPVETPVEQPVETPVEQPVEAPVEQPIDAAPTNEAEAT